MTDARSLRAGRSVRIEGLQKRSDLNGKQGKVVRAEGERWIVKVAGMDEIALADKNLVVEQPEKKRARFAVDETDSGKDEMQVKESGEDSMEDDEEDGEDKEEEDEAPEFTRWAEEVTTIRLINGGVGSDSVAGEFPPAYTHQIFFTPRPSASETDGEGSRGHQELIIGYEDPRLEVVYAANTLKSFFRFQHSAQVEVKLLRKAGLTRTSIINALQTNVPTDWSTKLSEVQEEVDKPFTPIGALREEETLPDGSRLQIFHFTADSDEAVKLVRRMQTFAIWLIETGQSIEVPDRKWNILTLYRVEKRADEQDLHTFIGFYSAYRYWAYDKEHNALDKYRLRLSQCIILPPFQRQGHGGRLLRAFYNMGREDATVLDMSVEDPGPEFQMLRDLTDMRQMSEEAGAIQTLANACGDYEPLSPLACKFKLCRPQMVRLSLIAKFVTCGITDADADPERLEIKDVRLAMKQMLYQGNVVHAKGRILLDDKDSDDEDGDKPNLARAGRGGGAAKRKKGDDGDDDEDEHSDIKKTAEAELQKQMNQLRLWSNGGDAEKRKAQLREMFAAKYKDLAAVAAKLSATLHP